MVRLDVTGLPEQPSAAAAVFHGEWLARARALLESPPLGEVAARSADGGGPHRPASGGPPPPEGETLTLVFPPADHTHTGWRLAAVQSLAREQAPLRVNAIASDDPAAIAAALAYLTAADGVTGQYLPLDSAGAGAVVMPAP